jgi:acyl-CoA thioester hydrolase
MRWPKTLRNAELQRYGWLALSSLDCRAEDLVRFIVEQKKILEAFCFKDDGILKQKMTFTYRIYYEDTDAGGVVYYANYLKFFERARTDFLRQKGISQSELAKNEGLIFVVRRCEIDYVLAAKLDDEVEVSVAIKERRAASLVMTQEMKNASRVLSRLQVEVACIDATTFKPKKIPQHLLQKLENDAR